MDKKDYDILCNIDSINHLEADTYLEMVTKYTQVTSFRIKTDEKMKILRVMHQKMNL